MSKRATTRKKEHDNGDFDKLISAPLQIPKEDIKKPKPGKKSRKRDKSS
ncbi:MAG: hypothetical protein KKG33_01045 [candidate division Zixibacteria bacterium]|nr:hypothetical protein [candidate division Zixibacteria bacterium]MBU1470653.1 hypothetical protein [candidate division Zixibacteria bacterium]MBU2624126.1 hypothetical protein [candidate division Zixibacteria bacterium]